MQEVAIYDARRVPKHWMELLRAGQYAAFILNVHTSVVLDSQGVPFAPGRVECCYFFDSLPEAKQFCAELVERADHARCEIYDQRGMAVEPLYIIAHKRHEHVIGSRKTVFWLILGGALLILVSLPLFWLEWKAQGSRIWPSFAGLNLVFAGVRLIHWGYSELEQLRFREAEQAKAESNSSSKKEP